MAAPIFCKGSRNNSPLFLAATTAAREKTETRQSQVEVHWADGTDTIEKASHGCLHGLELLL